MRTFQFMTFLSVSAVLVGCGISSTPTKSLTGAAGNAVAEAQREALGLGDMAIQNAGNLPALTALSFSGPLFGQVSTATQNSITSIPNLATLGTITSGIWQGTAISDTYLAAISTAGKVANSATTATSANTASTIVLRDATNNFSAGTITATLSGQVSAATQNSITSIPNLATIGTITSGTWQGTAISDTYLGTISTAGKVSNSATTATSANTASTIVLRDATNNFSAGTITATLSGQVSAATQSSITSIPNLATIGTITSGTWQGTAITDTFLATIATAGKVSNSATTATSANTASAIVARDANGHFAAETLKLTPRSTAPATCNSSTVDGMIGLHSDYYLCVCKNGTGWVRAADGTSACGSGPTLW